MKLRLLTIGMFCIILSGIIACGDQGPSQEEVYLEAALKMLVQLDEKLEEHDTGYGKAGEGEFSLTRDEATPEDIKTFEDVVSCYTRSKYNESLPEERLQYLQGLEEQRFWNELEAGQYTSFSHFVGNTRMLCIDPTLTEEGGDQILRDRDTERN